MTSGVVDGCSGTGAAAQKRDSETGAGSGTEELRIVFVLSETS